MYEFIDEIVGLGRRTLELTINLKLGDQASQRIVAFCLHARMVDLSSSVAALVRAHDVAGIPHLVRGQLEAYADLRNLLGDAAYLDVMEAAHQADVQRVLRAVVREGFDEEGLPDVAASLALAETRLKELAAHGVSNLKTADRFRCAGLLREYYSVYAYLCSHSHNNVTALEERHVNKAKTPHQLRILLDEIDQDLSVLIELSVRLPIASLGLLIHVFEQPLLEAYEQLARQLREARIKWAHLTGAPAESDA